MIFDFLTHIQGARPQKIAIVRTIHMSNSHTKFGSISSNGLGDSIMDGRM